jgi:hypothetical protein
MIEYLVIKNQFITKCIEFNLKNKKINFFNKYIYVYNLIFK